MEYQRIDTASCVIVYEAWEVVLLGNDVHWDDTYSREILDSKHQEDHNDIHRLLLHHFHVEKGGISGGGVMAAIGECIAKLHVGHNLTC